jgi:glucose-6-phosphate 1-dehydrogenase
MLATQKNEIIVFGASGDLAKRKIYPSLHSLYTKAKISHNNTRVIGYGRSPMDKETFQTHISSMIPKTSRSYDFSGLSESSVPSVPSDLSEFLDMCSYVSGQYTSFEALSNHLHSPSTTPYTNINRMFYLSIPSTIYTDVIENIYPLFSTTGWNRVLIEKPIGRDMESFQDLKRVLLSRIPDIDLYCIDHYLGKSVIQSIPDVRKQYYHLWNPQNIERIDILFSERIGIEDRRYFDDFGIVRDIVQNHLLQVCAVALSDNRKDIFKHMQPIDGVGSVFGQYKGYRDSPFVAQDTITPTYFQGSLYVKDGQWDHVPITITAGKALPKDMVEIVLITKDKKTIRIEIQPNPSITIGSAGSAEGAEGAEGTGSTVGSDSTVIHYPQTSAYETILHEALHGQKRLFVSMDEIEDSWKTLANVLDAHTKPLLYEFGSMTLEA